MRHIRTIRGITMGALAAMAALTIQLSTTGCGASPTPAEASTGEGRGAGSGEGATPVVVEPVERGALTRELVYVADLEATAAVTVYSPVTDRIEQFPYDNGDEVAAGQVLAVVRSEALSKGLAQVAAQIEGLEAQVVQAEADLRRSGELLAREVITEASHEQVRTGYLAALSSLQSARASFDQLAIQAGYARVESPIDGLVADRTQDRGDMATMQVPLCRVLDVDPIVMQLRLTEADVSRVAVGQPVSLAVDALPGQTFEGSVQRLMPYLDVATRTNTVEVQVPNPRDPATGARQLKPGMFGRATIEVDRRDDAIVAPDQALVLDTQLLAKQQPGQTLRRAYVIDDGNVARERLVEVGMRDGDRLEVLDGLQPGDLLVVRGQHQLSDGEAVTIRDTDTLAEAAPASDGREDRR